MRRVEHWAEIMRAIAIFSVICAHCNLEVVDAVTGYENCLMSSCGTVGVGIFFFLSGYFFKPFQQRGAKKIFQSMIIPWVTAATCVWLYVVLRKGGVNVSSWFTFVIGGSSLFYFMTDLLILQAAASVLSLFETPVFSLAFYLVSLALNIAAIATIGEFEKYLSPYLNPFVFVSFFAMGLYLRTHSTSRIKNLLRSGYLRSICTAASLFILLLPRQLTYFSGVKEIFFETLFILTVYMWSQSIGAFTGKRARIARLMQRIGEKSFSIYLWHIPIAGIISNICNRHIIMSWGGILWPFVILLLTIILLDTAEKVFRRAGLSEYLCVLGIR